MATTSKSQSLFDRNVRKMRSKINAYYSRVQSIYDSITKINESNVDVFMSNASTLDMMRTEFIKSLDDLNDLLASNEDATEPNYESMVAFDELFSRIKYKYSELMSLRHNTQNTANTVVGENKIETYRQCPKLPRLELCPFNGELQNWPIFYETFKSIIHENQSLSDSEKIQYLIGKLTGNAQLICQGFMPTAENYSVLWQTLVNKYNDKRVLAASYFDTLLNLPVANDADPISLENYIDKYSSLVSSLKQLKLECLEDFIFVHLGCKKISLELIKSFEMNYSDSDKLPTCTQFINYIRNQSHILQRAYNISNNNSIRINKYNSQQSNSNKPRNIRNNNVKTFVVHEQKRCIFCGVAEYHQLKNCSKFKSITPKERFSFIKTNRFCVNCLSTSHTVRNCTSNEKCSSCSRSHHSLLHFITKGDSGEVPKSVDIATHTDGDQDNAMPDSLCACALEQQCFKTVCNQQPTKTILLGTAICNIMDNSGTFLSTARILVDSASQRDLITLEFCKRLNLPIYPSETKQVCGVGDVKNSIEGYCCLTLCSCTEESVRITIQPLVINKITGELPTSKIDTSSLNYLKHIKLADDRFSQPRGIDLIVGSDVFSRILRPHIISRAPGEPVAIETSLGYIIVGQAPVLAPSIDNSYYTHCTFGEDNLDNENNACIGNFLKLEDIPDVKPYTEQEEECESLYRQTTTRDSLGRYIVSLPFKDTPSKLGDSLQASMRRYLSLERKLLLQPEMRQEYDKVIKDYLEKGYLNPCSRNINESSLQYVIPHHGIVRKDKSTTKLRVVLDGSMKSSSGLALNDILQVGPNLQNDLFRIILNFRLFNVAISADIRQMYLRILVKDEDRKFLRMLYRFDPSEEIKLYEFTRVPFGLCCSPFLAIRTVRQLVTDEGSQFPLAAPVADSDVFTDDLATSCANEETAVELSNQLIKMFHAGGFDLVKFSSNSPEVLSKIPSSHREFEVIEFSPDSYLKILGLNWLPAEDVFTFTVNLRNRECTKRNILSVIARIWDLMGFVAPVTLWAKLIIKSLWANNIDWDETPRPEIVAAWHRFVSELPILENVRIPRHTGIVMECIVSLLGFADASEKAYGGVVYLHVYFPQTNKFTITLVCAKSRVAPLRCVSLARLELCGNLILAKLMRAIIDSYSHRCKISNVFAFTDSTVALAWIHSSPARWHTFVANRVTKIQDEIHPRNFYFVSGKENPADCLSRGLTPSQLMEHPLWFSGPRFAHLPISDWPVKNFDATSMTDIPEMKPAIMLFTTDDARNDNILYTLACRISSWPKLVRIVLYVLRFIKLVPSKFDISHLKVAETNIIKAVQRVHFDKELKNVKSGKILPPAFQRLRAFVHEGIFRVGGRLENAHLEFDSQHPILLPARDHVVNLLIDYYHKKYLHTGPQLLMSLIRQNYWILSARNIIRKRVQQCNICYRANPRNQCPLMADLPACRVQETKAFYHTGIDYAGPLRIIPYRRRGVRSQKAYICLFICLVTKAVHLELSTDLSTAAFLNAFKRFIARRGPIKVVYTDCGTNFLGTHSYLKEMYKLISSEQYADKFANELRDNNIDWKFNPPSAPHFGGIWEGNIRSVKTHLNKIVGNQLLTFEEMLTTLAQIEALLNSRPLSVLSSDPCDPQALTPAHFINLTPLKSLPSETITEHSNLIQRKRIVDSLVQSFWKRWKLEYLNTLQVRNKWKKDSTPIKTGTVVLLQSENSAPLNWPLGIIEETFPGRDGVVRVVNVRTKTGTYRRPVVKVYPLPTQ